MTTTPLSANPSARRNSLNDLEDLVGTAAGIRHVLTALCCSHSCIEPAALVCVADALDEALVAMRQCVNQLKAVNVQSEGRA